MISLLRFAVAIPLAMAFSSGAYASSCSAKNETGGQCSIDCPAGQSAQCQDASGGGTPTCECRSSSGALPSLDDLTKRFAKQSAPAMTPIPVGLAR